MKQKSFFGGLLSHPVDQKKVLLRARKKAKKIVEDATFEANEILAEGEIVDKSFKENIQAELVREVEIGVKKQLHEMSEFLQSKTQEQWVLIEKELAEYKEQRKQNIDEVMKLEVRKLVTDAFIRSMPESMKEKLVFEALERAKKDGFFTNS